MSGNPRGSPRSSPPYIRNAHRPSSARVSVRASPLRLARMATRLAGKQSLLQSLWSAYSRSLETSPILTKGLTSTAGFIVGDVIAQATTQPRQPWDAWRTARFGLFGLLVHGPQCHFLYHLLDNVLLPGGSKRPAIVLAKMAIDQLIFTPAGTVVFYSAFKTMEGDAAGIPATLREKFIPTLLAGYTLWPLVHIINFRFVSNKYRVLYINVVQVGWNVILSRIAMSKAVTPATRSEAVAQIKAEFEP